MRRGVQERRALKGSIGCSFATLPPDAVTEHSEGSCFAALIANVWDRPSRCKRRSAASRSISVQATYYAEINGASVDYTHVDGPVPPGKVTIVCLVAGAPPPEGPLMPCPVTRGRSGGPHRPLDGADASVPDLRPTRRERLLDLALGGATRSCPRQRSSCPVSSWDKNYAAAINTWTPQHPGWLGMALRRRSSPPRTRPRYGCGPTSTLKRRTRRRRGQRHDQTQTWYARTR